MYTAISFAAYRAAVDLFQGDRASVFDLPMRRFGYDPANTTDDSQRLKESGMWPPGRSSSSDNERVVQLWAPGKS